MCCLRVPGKRLWGLGELWWGRLSLLHCSAGHEGGQENGVSSTPWVGGSQGRLGSPGDRVMKSPVPLNSAWAHSGSRGTLVCVRVSGQSHGEERAVPSLLFCKLNEPYSLSRSLYPYPVRIETSSFQQFWDSQTPGKVRDGPCQSHQLCLVTAGFPDILYKGQL